MTKSRGKVVEAERARGRRAMFGVLDAVLDALDDVAESARAVVPRPPREVEVATLLDELDKAGAVAAAALAREWRSKEDARVARVAVEHLDHVRARLRAAGIHIENR